MDSLSNHSPLFSTTWQIVLKLTVSVKFLHFSPTNSIIHISGRKKKEDKSNSMDPEHLNVSCTSVENLLRKCQANVNQNLQNILYSLYKTSSFYNFFVYICSKNKPTLQIMSASHKWIFSSLGGIPSNFSLTLTWFPSLLQALSHMAVVYTGTTTSNIVSKKTQSVKSCLDLTLDFHYLQTN